MDAKKRDIWGVVLRIRRGRVRPKEAKQLCLLWLVWIILAPLLCGLSLVHSNTFTILLLFPRSLTLGAAEWVKSSTRLALIC